MAKILTAEPEVSQRDEVRRQRKKQAKKEARTMLKIERAKKDVKKAQKKVTRAQSNLDESQTYLDNLAEKLQQIRSPQESEAASTSQTSSDDLPELQPEDFKIQEVSDKAYQEPLLLDNTLPEQQPLTQSEPDVSTDPSDELTTPSPEAVTETDTTSPEEEATPGTSSDNTQHHENDQEGNQ